ncbi:asparagine-rich protein-like [Homalodisca vitripennis]|uniref:asparagine-rich protein-like n=1 Tax=Homalodisca vitripennis TaxID=197043 RepID=UPI001EEA17D5|nr:asparagine-rich protein-like [Homalodisca vitripennis]
MAHNLRSNPKRNPRYTNDNLELSPNTEEADTQPKDKISNQLGTEKTTHTKPSQEHQNEEELLTTEEHQTKQPEGEELHPKPIQMDTTPTTIPTTSTPPMDLTTLMTFLNSKFDNIGHKIETTNQKIEHNNQEMTHIRQTIENNNKKIEDNSQKMEQQFTEHRLLITNTKQEITQSLKTYIDEQCNKITTDVNQRFTVHDTKMESGQKALKEELINKFESQLTSFTKNTDLKIENLVNELPLTIKHQTEQTIKHNNEELEDLFDSKYKAYDKQLNQTQDRMDQIHKITEQHSLSLKENTTQLANIHESLTQLKNTPSLENQNKANVNTTGIPEVIIHYEGNYQNELNSSLPKFNRKHKNPLVFLEQFEKYYETYLKRRGNKNPLSYLEMIEISLENSSASWYQIIKDDILDWEDFKRKFINQYWSQSIQRAWRKKIEFETYNEKSRLSRSEYLIDRSLILKSITPAFTETDIVNILSDNFNNRIRDSSKVQNVTILQHFIDILNKEDLEDKTDRTKKNNDDRPNQFTNCRNQKSYQDTRNQHRNFNPNIQDTYDKYNNYIPRPHYNNYNTRDRQSYNHNQNHPQYQRNPPQYRPNNNSQRYDRNNRQMQNTPRHHSRERYNENPSNYRGNRKNSPENNNSPRFDIRHLQLQGQRPDPEVRSSNSTTSYSRLTREQQDLINSLQLEPSSTTRPRSDSLPSTRHLATGHRTMSYELLYRPQYCQQQSRTTTPNNNNHPSNTTHPENSNA